MKTNYQQPVVGASTEFIRSARRCSPFMRTRLFVMCVAVVTFILGTTGVSFGTIIYESATLAGEGKDSTLHTYVLSYGQSIGTRVHFDQPVDVTSIGGHLVGESGTFFGAILSLDSPTDLPSGDPIDMSEVVAYGTFGSSEIYPSKDFRLPLSVILDPGDYAVVFGSGALGTYGYGGMPYIGQQDLPQASYITWQPSMGWFDTTSTGTRFVVEGSVIPEPATLLLLGLGGLAVIRRRRA